MTCTSELICKAEKSHRCKTYIYGYQGGYQRVRHACMTNTQGGWGKEKLGDWA